MYKALLLIPLFLVAGCGAVATDQVVKQEEKPQNVIQGRIEKEMASTTTGMDFDKEQAVIQKPNKEEVVFRYLYSYVWYLKDEMRGFGNVVQSVTSTEADAYPDVNSVHEYTTQALRKDTGIYDISVYFLSITRVK